MSRRRRDRASRHPGAQSGSGTDCADELSASLRARVEELRPTGSTDEAVVLRFVVPNELAGLRLDRFVQERMPRLTRTRAQKIVRSSAFHLDGARRRPADIVKSGEVVYLVRERFVEPPTPLYFGVLHEDADVLLVDKPAGLPMHPTATYHKHTLSYLLRQHYDARNSFVPRIAHRLDRETSGVVLCANTLAAERMLKKAFERHEIEKSYLAIVRGSLPDSGDVELAMAPVKEGLHVLMEVREDGLRAFTHYEVRARANDHCLVALFPKSGRQHQLRVHLAALGCPIIGDKLYGPEREAPFLEYIETGMTESLIARLGHERQALHAHTLSFTHPGSGERFDIEAPIPPDMVALWQRVRGEARVDLTSAQPVG